MSNRLAEWNYRFCRGLLTTPWQRGYPSFICRWTSRFPCKVNFGTIQWYFNFVHEVVTILFSCPRSNTAAFGTLQPFLSLYYWQPASHKSTLQIRFWQKSLRLLKAYSCRQALEQQSIHIKLISYTRISILHDFCIISDNCSATFGFCCVAPKIIYKLAGSSLNIIVPKTSWLWRYLTWLTI